MTHFLIRITTGKNPQVYQFWIELYNFKFATHLLQNASQCPLALTGDKCFASLTNICSEPLVWREVVVVPEGFPLLAELFEEFDFMLNFLKLSPWEWEEPESDGMNLSPTIMSPRYVVTSSNGSLCKKRKNYISCVKELQHVPLTLSWSWYHWGCGLSNTLFCRLIITSPKKSLRPNISECQMVNHKVRDSKLLRDI